MVRRVGGSFEAPPVVGAGGDGCPMSLSVEPVGLGAGVGRPGGCSCVVNGLGELGVVAVGVAAPACAWDGCQRCLEAVGEVAVRERIMM